METAHRPIILAPGEGEQRVAHTGPYTVKLGRDESAGGYMVSENSLPPGLFHPPHTHDSPEAFYVLEGSFELIIDGRTYDAPAGTFAYIPPNLPHGYRAGPAGGRKLNLS